MYEIIRVIWKLVMYLYGFEEKQGCLICSNMFSLSMYCTDVTFSSEEQVQYQGLLHVCHLCYISAAPAPFTFLENCLIPSPEILIFLLRPHFKLAQIYVFVSFGNQFGAEVDLCPPLCLFYILSSLSFSVSATLSRSLMRFHSLSLLCQPPLAKRENVYFKRCAMHQPPPHRHSAEEKTGTTQAC